ncbi:MAG: Cytochrome c biogenesis protein CcsA [Candidatus Udaeobacter sp.]|jgi:ABC-type transport system involved in cytochrome c biogenesis permease subunit|nr:MAG: Cytochrome c biogenesis protein CcsA [Candidatus Udaeobacter sp.]
MKRFLPILPVSLGILWVASSFFPPKPPGGDVDFVRFGKIPVQVGGRVKPLDTVARNSLLIIHSKQTLRPSDGRQVSAIKWLADTLFNAPMGDAYPAFVIQNGDVLGLFGWQQSDRKYFSFAEVTPFLKQIEEQGAQAEKLQAVERSAYQNAILNLRNAISLYQRLKNSVQPEGTTNFSAELEAFEREIPNGAKAARARETGEKFDQAQLDRVAALMQRYEKSAELAYILPVPPRGQSSDWRSIGQTLLQSVTAGEIDPVVRLYASLGDAYRSGDHAAFNADVDLLTNRLTQTQPVGTQRARYEFFFNYVDPFTHSMTLYVIAFLLACISWLGWSRPLNRAAFYLLLVSLAVHTFGLVSRMYLQERPPVTNLYSSAIFIGWGAVIVALILERIFRDGIGAACAGAVGFVTLVIAHHLAGSGDTLEMLQAVLDTNIWLATHVVAITTGYSAMFLAGMLSIIYVIRGVFTRSLTPQTATSLARMTYGVVCFATLFSFVGTVLGGIWADQSWGRFWGWDPKENGALLIVLWCAIILHARWGEYIGQRGLMGMAIFGNVITSFSWFGVNMLGIGLHSYGFMQKAFPWLVGFMLSQLALMTIAGIPLKYWRSSRTSPDSSLSTRKHEHFEFTPPKLAVETTQNES